MAKGSRFNKILNFIGLVDEADDPNMGYDPGRPQGAQTYNPSSRRQPQGTARPVRQQGYEDPRYPAPSSRYDDRDYQPRYDDRNFGGAQPRYGSDSYQRNYDAPQGNYRGQPSYERASQRADYEPPRSAGRVQGDYRSQGAPQGRAGSARNDYYSQRNASQPREYQPAPERTPVPERPARDNVVSIRTGGQAQTVIYYLHALEECRDVIQDLLDNKTVLLNLEDMDERLIQRGIDTLCGAAFALNATLRKASDKTYLIAPNSVAVAQTTERY